MRTDELVTLLSSGESAPAALPSRQRLTIAVGLGTLGAIAEVLAFLGLNEGLARDAQLPMFWVKAVFPLLLAAAAVLAVARLSRPGARLAALPAALIAPLLAMGILAAIALAGADPAQRLPLLLGETWALCPPSIALLSLPALVALLWAMKGLAPTRLRLAGVAAGLLAGAIGAFAYVLHCPELAAPFLATWYVLGMLIPAAAGALLGPRVLAW